MAAIFTAFVQLVHGGEADAMSAVLATLATPPAPARPNILALAFDDLRPWFLPFQDSSIAAPSFLRLAKGALAFNST